MCAVYVLSLFLVCVYVHVFMFSGHPSLHNSCNKKYLFLLNGIQFRGKSMLFIDSRADMSVCVIAYTDGSVDD